MRRLFDFRTVPRGVRTLILANMLFWSVISYLLITRFAFMTGEVAGDSMLPALHEGDRYLINRWVYRWRGPRPCDVIALRMPNEEELSVKRVVALPGELVQIKDGRVLVNGRPVQEPYLEPGTRTGGKGLSDSVHKVADDCYFVLGDNRAASEDSRRFGAVPRDWIVGRVSVRAPQAPRK